MNYGPEIALPAKKCCGRDETPRKNVHISAVENGWSLSVHTYDGCDHKEKQFVFNSKEEMLKKLGELL